MPTIRYKHNYAYVNLNGINTPDTKAMSGRSIPALRKNGEYRFMPFSGFIKHDQTQGVQLVKLINIVGFTFDDMGITGWYEIPLDNYCVGIYQHGTYKVILRDGLPVTLPLESN
ncbi:conserved hypothetical protein [Vibrio crassostreae]|nr:conserved hypothetical protein [Vibrio crassostreae]CAK2335154.1 conserved hypothetical protein [Vibrio crassostreae]CAK2503549.1 conserved hypothetical protein [Vibrio crassostreae]CAK2910873.1 conserved hypothetical protein [Vibrio crassostreae]